MNFAMTHEHGTILVTLCEKQYKVFVTQFQFHILSRIHTMFICAVIIWFTHLHILQKTMVQNIYVC